MIEQIKALDKIMVIKGLVMMAVLVAIGLLLKSINFEGFINGLGFATHEQSDWWSGRGGFILISGVCVAFACPRQIISFSAAYFFGLTSGIWVALSGVVLGCVISYCIALMFKELVIHRLRGRVLMVIDFWRDNPFSTTLFYRLLPLGSNFMVNYAAGALNIPFVKFVAGSAVGYMPQTVIFALLGSGVNVGSYTQVAVAVALFIVSMLIGMRLFTKFQSEMSS